MEVGASEGSIYKDTTTIPGYKNLYITGLQNKKLSSGQTAYIYLTFRVDKDTDSNGEKWIKLDEFVSTGQGIGVGKENIAEINGYRTYYKNGTYIPNYQSDETVHGFRKVAGLLDIDSVPGNLDPNDVPKDGKINQQHFEDDTDKAPNIRLILYREGNEFVVRSTDGIVWEDERNQVDSEQKTNVGNGIYDDGEKGINGVTVQLVELMDNGTEYVWKTFSSGLGLEWSAIDGTIGINQEGLRKDSIIGNKNYGTQDAPMEDIGGVRGKYMFNSYMPGNYIIRFIYGDTVRTILPNMETAVTDAYGRKGENEKSYNGQDYKSTTYQKGINQNLVSEFRKQGVWKNENGNLQYIWRENSTWQNGRETLGKEKTTISTFKSDASNNETVKVLPDGTQVSSREQYGYMYDITASDQKADVSDAKDIMKDDEQNKAYGRQSKTLKSREDVIKYSNSNVKNFIAEVLASHEKMPLSKLEEKLEELRTETQMTAETGMMVIEFEYDIPETSGKTVNNSTSYKISNVNLGLEERPKAGLSVNKKVTNIKLTLADGSTLFDATQKADNLLWIKRDNREDNYKYANYKIQGDPMQYIRNKNTAQQKFGFAQLTMDEELMHGATIKISYEIKVTNIGEVDYKDNLFYYTGTVHDRATLVKTEPNKLIDYVANNLQFYKVDNPAWQVIDKDTLFAGSEANYNKRETLVHNSIRNDANKYNTIIETSADSKIAKAKLEPKIYNESKSVVTDDLVLTQLITSENKSDDLKYRNITEIVVTSNDVGRRNAYSVVGNQNPVNDPEEIDTDRADIVQILPPYGSTGTNYIIAIIVAISSVVLIVGIIFIKKKVLK